MSTMSVYQHPKAFDPTKPIKPPKRPRIKIKDDREMHVAKAAECLGFTIAGKGKSLAVWRFGFLPGSVLHSKTGIKHPEFTWVISTYGAGRVKAQFKGFACELPEQFKAVLGRG